MTALHSLRHATRLTVMVLVWFVLTLAAAVAAPLLTNSPERVICSANGHYVQTSDQNSDPTEQARLHCPLCLVHISAAPPTATPDTLVLPLAQPLPSPLVGVLISVSTIIPPARAPPVFS